MRVTSALPNLYEPSEFQHWYIGQRSSYTAQEILMQLETNETPVSRLRQAFICYISPELENKFLPLARECLNDHEKAISCYARALIGFEYLRSSFGAGEINEFESAGEIAPMLERSLKELLNEPLTNFVRETESAIRATLAHAYLVKGDTERGHSEAAEALFWAKELNAPVSEARARNKLLNTAKRLGRIHETSLALENRDRDVYGNFAPLATLYEGIVLANCYRHLGAFDKALKTLESLGEMQSHPRILVLIQRFQCLQGIGGVSGEVLDDDTGTMATSWIASALRSIIEADGLPRVSQTVQLRRKLYDEARSAVMNTSFFPTPWHVGLQRWLISYIQMRLGNKIAAVSTLNDIKEIQDEWLELRTLIVGAKLELSMALEHPELPTKTFEDELHAIFELASNLPIASSQGLATYLQRWHPLAATYGAIMPRPIHYLQSSIDSILHVGKTNAVYGEIIAPSYACELLLRSLDLDLRPNHTFTQSRLNDRDRRKREVLLQGSCGEVPLWKPVVSVPVLVLGLSKGSNQHLAIAASLTRNFGVVPKTNALYTEIGIVEAIEAATQQLIAGLITPKGFTTQILDSLC